MTVRFAFASDFDKTFYFGDRDPHIGSEDLQAALDFQSGGNLFGVCTGRSLHGIDFVMSGVLDFDFYILATGSLVLDRQRNIIYRSLSNVDAIKDLNAEYEGKTSIIIQANDTVYNFGEPLPMQTHVDSFDEIGPNIYGLSMYVGSAESAKSEAAHINDEFGSDLVAYPNSRIVDVVARGCSKGHAVTVAKEHFGVECMAAAGDSFNDISMLDSADVSFTFESSPSDVQSHATHVVSSISQAFEMLR